MKLILSFIALVFFISACNEKEILKEIPRDFLTSENAYKKPSDIQTALNDIYYGVREYKQSPSSDERGMDMWLGTDFGWSSRDYYGDALSNHNILTATNRYPNGRWATAYKIIANANVILSKIQNITYPNDADKNENIAQARFFRAWAYRILAILYGDVPLILEETIGPKRDYARAPKADVFKQCKEDIEFAAANLRDIENVPDGRLNKQAAYHLLSEVSLCLGDHQGAVTAATQVINHPGMALMTHRFGSRINDTPGDPYYDLFRINNQNRSSGNTESIWVLQVEYGKGPGSWGDPAGTASRWERNWGPLYWGAADVNGVSLMIGPTTYHGGRAGGFFRMSYHALVEVWGNPADYANDIRNQEQNIKRKFWIDNPVSPFYNDTIDLNKPYTAWQQYLSGPANLESDTNFIMYPFPMKFSMTNHHFASELVDGVGPLMRSTAGRSYMDYYEMRLAETYLLRAEGYLGLGNKAAAAADINVVRARAHVSPASAADITIDYILDERLRELYCEEPRRLTLGRLGLIYDRAKKYNSYAASSIKPFNNLWPIPFSEIERNVLNPLPQNPGY
ncbi:MAG: RagB/SusD family nutrient uptake outer membrane protein [Chitinophagaceae bacterium]